ncbi:FtsX-like permease family protein [Saccharibacillus sacchari]|uniref:FtsX-like permease family protein n=1 Tax=Saccharibacillus sacchari TaxID=456493 RepID=UPI0004BA3055|nr:FtsX-like permease family protein [Saccharibacillus sacchari]
MSKGNVRGKSVLARIALRQLRAHRIQSVITGCAIVLTTLLLTALFTLGFSLNKSMELAAMKTAGTDYHGSFKKLTVEQADMLATAPQIREFSRTVYIGRIQHAALTNSRLEVIAVDGNYPSHAFISFEQGGLPEQADGIALSGWTLDELEIPRELGAAISLDVRTDEGDVRARTFRLSGWYETDRYLSDAGGNVAGLAFVSKSFAAAEFGEYNPTAGGQEPILTGSTQLYVKFQNCWNIRNKMHKVMQNADLSVDYGVNWAYASESLLQQPANMLPYAGLLLIVMLSGYLLIYNIFHISVVRDIRFFGLLKTIGTSPRQIRRIVLVQSNRLYLLALPIGLLLGYGVGSLLSPYATSLATGVTETAYSVHPVIFMAAAIFSYLTVRLSAGRPARMASAATPVDAAKYVEVSVGRKKRHHGKGIVKGGTRIYRMAWRNLIRSPRRLVIMLASLSLSLIVFGIVSNIIGSVSMEKYLNDYIVGDWMLREEELIGVSEERLTEDNSSLQGHALNNEVAEHLERLPGISSVDRVYWEQTEFTVDDSISRLIADKQPDLPKRESVPVQMYGLGAGFYDLLKKDDVVAGTFDSAKFAQGGYVLVTEALLGGEPKYASYYRPGDRLRLPGSAEQREVMAVLRYDAFYAIGTRYFSQFGFNIYAPEAEVRAKHPNASLLVVSLEAVERGATTSSADTLGASVQAIASEHIGVSVRSRENYRQELSRFVNVFRLIGYGLCMVIALIGLLNYANTVLSSIFSRRKELAAMESIGMTKKQLRTLLFAEGLWITGLTSAIVLLPGMWVTASMVRTITEQMAFTVFRMRIWPTVAMLLVLLVIAYALTRMVCRMLAVSSITERLRE